MRFKAGNCARFTSMKPQILSKCQIEHRPGKFSLLFRWQLSSSSRSSRQRRWSKSEMVLSYRFLREGRVIVNSRSVNRRKTRSEWFEFLSCETNGWHDSRILMRHAKYRGVKVLLFSLFSCFRFRYGSVHVKSESLYREYTTSSISQ